MTNVRNETRLDLGLPGVRLGPLAGPLLGILIATSPASSARASQGRDFGAWQPADGEADSATGVTDDPVDDSDTDQPPTEASQDADTNDDLRRAMRVYQRGAENYALKRYEQALADFQEAASLHASANFQYNIGLCYEKLGRYSDAMRSFNIYLRANPDADDADEVRATIARLEDQRQEQERAQSEAERKRREANTKTIIIDNTDTSVTPFIVSGSVMLGLGAALALSGGLTFGILAQQRADELDSAQFGGNPDRLTFDQIQDIETEGRRFEIAQISTIAIGSAVAVAGASILGVGLHRRRTQRRNTEQQSRLQIRSYGSQTSAGLILSGRF